MNNIADIVKSKQDGNVDFQLIAAKPVHVPVTLDQKVAEAYLTAVAEVNKLPNDYMAILHKWLDKDPQTVTTQRKLTGTLIRGRKKVFRRIEITLYIGQKTTGEVAVAQCGVWDNYHCKSFTRDFLDIFS